MSSGEPSSLDPVTIEQWCHAAATGDTEAFANLLRAYQSRFMGVIRRKIGVDWRGKIDPEDLYQTAVADAAEAMAGFTYQDEDSFYRWVVRIIDHRFIDQVRRLRRQSRDVDREVATGAMTESTFGHLLEQVMRDSMTASRIMRRHEALDAMSDAVSALPADQREVVERRYLRQESWGVTAAGMHRSEDAVRRLASRAVQRLAEVLGRRSRYLSGHD